MAGRSNAFWICSRAPIRARGACASPAPSAAFLLPPSAWPFSRSMNRAELEHIIRAASGIVGDRDIVIIGSQAVLAQYPAAPLGLLASIEADVFPRHRPDLSIQIDGAIGERSLFHETFGYYAH